MIRKGLAELLHGQPNLTVVGEAEDGARAVRLAARLTPDVILMDVTMPNMDGIEATACITGLYPGICVIGLSMHTDDDTRQKMLDAGAVGFLAKTDSPDKLLKAIRHVQKETRKANDYGQ